MLPEVVEKFGWSNCRTPEQIAKRSNACRRLPVNQNADGSAAHSREPLALDRFASENCLSLARVPDCRASRNFQEPPAPRRKRRRGGRSRRRPVEDPCSGTPGAFGDCIAGGGAFVRGGG